MGKKNGDEAAMRLAVTRTTEDDGRGFRFRLQHAINCRMIRELAVNGLSKFNQVTLAREVRQHDQAISRYVHGKQVPRFVQVARIAIRLECSGGWLIFGGAHGRPTDGKG